MNTRDRNFVVAIMTNDHTFRDMRLTSIGGGADEVTMLISFMFIHPSFVYSILKLICSILQIFHPSYISSFIYLSSCSIISIIVHLSVFSLYSLCRYILGDAANHLQNDGNSSKADQKVAHWPPPPSGFHTDTNVHVYLFIREMSKRYQ